MRAQNKPFTKAYQFTRWGVYFSNHFLHTHIKEWDEVRQPDLCSKQAYVWLNLWIWKASFQPSNANISWLR